MYESCFPIHGIGVKLSTKSFAICEAFSDLSQDSLGSEAITSDVRVELHAIAHLNQIPTTILKSKCNLIRRKGKLEKEVKRFGLTYEFYQDQEKLVIELYQYGLIFINGPGALARAYLVKPESMDLELRSFFVNVAIAELLRWKGLYEIHAVAMERFGKGVMIAGKPGLGKTTAGLSLLRAGYGFISDDFPFLRIKESRIEILAGHDRIDVREKTLGFFPELQTIPLTRRDRSKKDSFYVNDLFPGTKVDSCECHLLLFPQVVSEKQSYLKPMSKHLALKELLPQGLLIHDKEIAKREFQLYSTLVERTPCYRLHYGEDRWDLPTLLDPILQKCCGDGSQMGVRAASFTNAAV
ncbi:hypothetical protein [Candidatus Nitronereus thalassa]|uniref:HPr kinase/phosphorylase C-terminal domain-containing protein n=1 Tax=Candidatus Nitronereus thalassa TaxID=3020898 RepID=A0ABU3K5E2_9BACT|nr:hypothetical protein [Candidatus Nitronereus thalassa]MDT7041593.1 hypothetical protein [Candidatus Nitronereus thalassa]